MIMQSKPLIQIIIRFPSLCDFIFFFDGGGQYERTDSSLLHIFAFVVYCDFCCEERKEKINPVNFNIIKNIE